MNFNINSLKFVSLSQFLWFDINTTYFLCHSRWSISVRCCPSCLQTWWSFIIRSLHLYFLITHEASTFMLLLKDYFRHGGPVSLFLLINLINVFFNVLFTSGLVVQTHWITSACMLILEMKIGEFHHTGITSVTACLISMVTDECMSKFL